jgi:hypothetical protein
MKTKLRLVWLLLAMTAAGNRAMAQSSCVKTPYTKKIRVIGRNNNIIENMDFESGTYDWFLLHNSSREAIVTDPTNPSNHCARVISTDNAGGDALITQNIPFLTAGNTYTMSAYIRTNGLVNSHINTTLAVRFNYPGGGSTTIPVLFYPTSTWQKYSFNFTVPTASNVQVAQAQIYVYRGQQDTIYVDSMRISDSNLVANADFERGVENWSQIPSTSRVSLASYGCRGSATCMKLTSLNNSDGDALLSQAMPNLSLGKRYTVRAYMRSLHASPTNSAAASFQVRLNYTNGFQVFRDTLIKPDSVWRAYTYSFTTPDTLQILNSLMQIYYYRGANDSVYVDNLELLNTDTIYNMTNSSVPHAPTGILEDHFTGTAGQKLNPDRWLVVKRTWGANNNGVVPENIELFDTGGLRLHGHGNLYDGPIKGATNYLGNGKIHVGACIATKDYYASGEYEVIAKLTPGMINAFWTFHYIEDAAYQSGGIKNTEIDFEFPGAITDTVLNPGYTGHKAYIDDMNVNTWGGLCNGEGVAASLRYTKRPQVLSDDYHKYTIKWHTGGGGITPRVEWYVDDTLARTVTDTNYVGFRAARFWLGVWYSKDIWVNGNDTSLMQYYDKYMDIKSVKITPYYEPNDVYENETEPGGGYVTPQYHGYPTYHATSGLKPGNGNPNVLADIARDDVRVGVNIPDHQVYLSLITNSDNYFESVRILNMNGQVIDKINYAPGDKTTNITLATGRYSTGMYVVQCKTNSGDIFYKKINVVK